METNTKVPGRGGAILTLLTSDADTHTFLLGTGASRNEQFDDFWTVKVDRKTY